MPKSEKQYHNSSKKIIKHKSMHGYPSRCIICGKTHNNLMVFEYRNGIWPTNNFCSEKCFSKMGISYLQKIDLEGKKWHDFWAKKKGYDKYIVLEQGLTRDPSLIGKPISIREYIIDNDAVVDVGIFSCFWTPEDKENYFCIVCGKAFKCISKFDIEKKELYTLDFCSDNCLYH